MDVLQSAWIDHIPAVWLEPQSPQPSGRLAIFLNGLSGNKEGMLPYLTDLAKAGFTHLVLTTGSTASART